MLFSSIRYQSIFLGTLRVVLGPFYQICLSKFNVTKFFVLNLVLLSTILSNYKFLRFLRAMNVVKTLVGLSNYCFFFLGSLKICSLSILIFRGLISF